MVRLYSNEVRLPSGVKSIKYPEATFAVSYPFSKIDDTDRKIMKQIDDAEVIDLGLRRLKTPFGFCYSDKLSMGCKTALLANHLKKTNNTRYAIDIISCGYNAMDVIYELLDDTGICILQVANDTMGCKWRGTLNLNDGMWVGNVEDFTDYVEECTRKALELNESID